MLLVSFYEYCYQFYWWSNATPRTRYGNASSVDTLNPDPAAALFVVFGRTRPEKVATPGDAHERGGEVFRVANPRMALLLYLTPQPERLRYI